MKKQNKQHIAQAQKNSARAWVNNVKVANANIATVPAGGLPASIAANAGLALNITIAVSNGYSYQVKLITSKGNAFLYTATAPS